MKKLLIAIFFGLLVVLPARAQSIVGTAIVLAIDVSGSIDQREYELQKEGIASAFRHPAVLRAIWAHPEGRIAVTVVEWSDRQTQVVPWTIVDGIESAELFAMTVSSVTRSSSGGTHIGDALLFSRVMLDQCPCVPARRVIDVSGDGHSNGGAPVEVVRDEIVADGTTINGLAILQDEPQLDEVYRDTVVGGPGAFVMVANTFEDFAYAMRNKLVRETVDAGEAIGGM
jgi:hypothetical protein